MSLLWRHRIFCPFSEVGSKNKGSRGEGERGEGGEIKIFICVVWSYRCIPEEIDKHTPIHDHQIYPENSDNKDNFLSHTPPSLLPLPPLSQTKTSFDVYLKDDQEG